MKLFKIASLFNKLSLLFLCALSVTATITVAQDDDCSPDADYGFVCGLEHAEDLVLVPGTDWILSSGMSAGSSFYLINAGTKVAQVVSSTDAIAIDLDTSRYSDCPGIPQWDNFISHGLNLRQGQGTESTLYVVTHGARESIEIFTIDSSPDVPALTWKGCVLMPDGLAANSVASFSDGTLVATVLIHPDKTVTDAIAERPTGAVYTWGPGDSGFSLIMGTELPANNGIEVSADESMIFVASSGLRTVVAFPRGNPVTPLRSTGRLGIIPDNVHLGPGGKMITAGMNSFEPGCGGDYPPAEEFNLEEVAACPRGSVAYTIDPESMAVRVLARAGVSSLFSNATMALPVGDEIWFGTFSGDRVGYVKLQ